MLARIVITLKKSAGGQMARVIQIDALRIILGQQWLDDNIPLTRSKHVWAAGRRAVLWDGPVQQIDVFEECYRCKKKNK